MTDDTHKKETEEFYAKLGKPKCGGCGKEAIPLVFGKPAQVLIDLAEEGKIQLGGCSPDEGTHWCKTCEKAVKA